MPSVQVFDPHVKGRVSVAYEYDPSVDYWKQISDQCPDWVPPPLAEGNNASNRRGAGRAVTWHDEPSGTREVLINVPGKGLVEWVMPYQKYVPALDPAGNICPLTTVTCRLPEDDSTGFADKIQARKRSAGWLILTPDQEYQGLQDQEYACFALALSAQRKAAHAQREKDFAATQMSGAEKAVKDQSAQLVQTVREVSGMNQDMMVQIAEAVAAAVTKQLGGKAAK